MAGSLEDSDFTSIQQRLEERARKQHQPPPVLVGSNPTNRPRRPELAGFTAPGQSQGEEVLPRTLDAYVDLLADTGASVRAAGASPALPDRSVRTLERLGIRSELWLESLRGYPRRFFSMVGCVHRIAVYCARTDRCHAKGSAWAGRAFRNCA